MVVLQISHLLSAKAWHSLSPALDTSGDLTSSPAPVCSATASQPRRPPGRDVTDSPCPGSLPWHWCLWQQHLQLSVPSITPCPATSALVDRHLQHHCLPPLGLSGSLPCCSSLSWQEMLLTSLLCLIYFFPVKIGPRPSCCQLNPLEKDKVTQVFRVSLLRLPSEGTTGLSSPGHGGQRHIPVCKW